jgi:hypothetical protein
MDEKDFGNLGLSPIARGQYLERFDLLLWGELGTITADAALCSGPRQAELGTLFQDCALELGKAPEHLHEHSANWRQRIDRFGQAAEARTDLLECFQDAQEIG